MVNKPFSRSVAEIKKITLPQLYRAFFCERDEKGQPVIKHTQGGRNELGTQEIFWIWWRKRGLSNRQIRKKWKVYATQQQELEKRNGG